MGRITHEERVIQPNASQKDTRILPVHNEVHRTDNKTLEEYFM